MENNAMMTELMESFKTARDKWGHMTTEAIAMMTKEEGLTEYMILSEEAHYWYGRMCAFREVIEAMGGTVD